MKRREFILSSALTLAGTAFLAGCQNNDKIIKKEGKVAKRKFKNIEMPLLGMGCMRLPMQSENVDMEELEKMADYLISHGANYFDTAYKYVDEKSETAIGTILKNYKREDFLLADKSPIYKMTCQEDVKKIFDEQLKKCQVEYFDLYLCHNINNNVVDIYRNVKMYDELSKLKKEGKIKYLGFSFHGTPDLLKEIVNEHKWDFCQLQINYLDWELVKAKDQYEIAQSANLPIIVMQPLRGGGLVKLSEKSLAKLQEQNPNVKPAEFGLRCSASHKDVMTVLSGMSSLQQVKDNVETFINFKEITAEEEKIAVETAKIIQSQGEIRCTGCKYCLEVCPKGINIPAIFTLYNQYKLGQKSYRFQRYYDSLAESERPDKCIKCGLCVKNCPQHLEIPKLLAKVKDEYDKIPKKSE